MEMWGRHRVVLGTGAVLQNSKIVMAPQQPGLLRPILFVANFVFIFETDSLRDVFAGLRTVSVVVTLESLCCISGMSLHMLKKVPAPAGLKGHGEIGAQAVACDQDYNALCPLVCV